MQILQIIDSRAQLPVYLWFIFTFWTILHHILRTANTYTFVEITHVYQKN